MGADITIEGTRAVVRGIGRDKLCAAPSWPPAGPRRYHLERGYVNMVEKLQGLGARIRKVRE